MKKFILDTMFNRPVLAALVRYLAGFTRHKPKILGLRNPLYVSHYFVEQNGSGYLVASNPALAHQIPPGQIVKFDPRGVETELCYLIKLLIKPENTVLDVGANVGLYTVAFARAAHKGHVYAFEPVVEAIDQNSLACARHGLENVTFVTCAVGAEPGEEEMNVAVPGTNLERYSSFHKTMNIEKNPEKYYSRKVPVRRLDDLIEELKPIGTVSFIKIDTEGFEPMVLKGGMETIRKYLPIMIIEAHSTRLLNAGYSFQWYLDTFPDYQIFIVHPSTQVNPYLKLEPLESNPPEISVNLLFLPATAKLEIGLPKRPE